MKIFYSIFIFILLLTTTVNLTFLIEISKDKELKDFFYTSEKLSENYFQKEKIHMQEVKDLVIKSLIFNLILIICFIIIKKKINFKHSGYTGLAILFFSILLPFKKIFQGFHTTLFKSDNWLLPGNSTLIQNYPLNYFKTIFITIIILLIIENIILINFNKIRKI
jgi:hypothetical protein